MTADFHGMIEPVARQLLGEPNAKLSTRQELRYGTNGSVSVDLGKDTWYDHETEEGGGVLKLITRETGRTDAAEWMRENGYDLPTRADASRRVDETAYDYVDEHGELLFQVVRRAGHQFVQRKPAADGWEYRVRGVRLVPYRLPELLARADEVVYIAEGEKDVDNLRASGLLATCNSGGAGKWRREHAQALVGRVVVILPDNDEPGQKHAQQVADSLQGIASSVRIVELPNLPPKGDVSDWLAAGGTREQLEALCAEAPAPQNPLRAVPLDDVMQVDEADWPHVMAFYLPRRVTTLIGGHGGVGKSMLALILAAHVAAGRPWGPLDVVRERAVFLSFEDPGEILRIRVRRIVEAYSLPAADVLANLVLLDGSDAETELAIESREGDYLEFTPMMGLVSDAVRGAGFVVIDNASDTYGASENERRQVRRFLRRLTAEARTNNAAVALLAHVDKQAAKGSGKGQNFSGSTQWHNSVRSRLALVESDEEGIQLLHEKANYGARHEPVALQRLVHGVLTPVAPAAAAANREQVRTLTANADAEALLTVFEALIAGGVEIPTAETGQRTTFHVLSLAPEMPDHLKRHAGKERTKAAVMALERAGRLCRESYRRDGKDRQRWALAYLPAQEAA